MRRPGLFVLSGSAELRGYFSGESRGVQPQFRYCRGFPEVGFEHGTHVTQPIGRFSAFVQNGQVVLKKGYGFADLSPARRVDRDKTLFRIGSISKTFTWIALMNEIEADVAGTVVEVFPKNGQPVEFGEKLFGIRPA